MRVLGGAGEAEWTVEVSLRHQLRGFTPPVRTLARSGLPDTLQDKKKLKICQKQTCFVNFLSCEFYFLCLIVSRHRVL